MFEQKEAVQEIMDYICESIRNPQVSNQPLVFYGPPGTGKNLVAERILAPALGRKLRTIRVAGVTDPNVIKGHQHTYVGSEPGAILKAIQSAQEMDPIIFIDELDKAHPDVVKTIIEATDLTSSGFQDLYFPEIQIPTSRILFVISVNSLEFINEVLRGRLKVVTFKKYSLEEKIKISQQYILPEIWEELKIDPDEPFAEFSEESLTWLLSSLPPEDGVRDLKKHLRHLVARINTAILSGFNTEIVPLERQKLPIDISRRIIKELLLSKGVFGGQLQNRERISAYIS